MGKCLPLPLPPSLCTTPFSSPLNWFINLKHLHLKFCWKLKVWALSARLQCSVRWAPASRRMLGSNRATAPPPLSLPHPLQPPCACDINTMNNIRSFLLLLRWRWPPLSCPLQLLQLLAAAAGASSSSSCAGVAFRKAKGVVCNFFKNKIFFISLLRWFSCNLRKTNKKGKWVKAKAKSCWASGRAGERVRLGLCSASGGCKRLNEFYAACLIMSSAEAELSQAELSRRRRLRDCAQPALNSLTKAKGPERAGNRHITGSLARRCRCCGGDAIRQEQQQSKRKKMVRSRESESTSYANEFLVIAACVAAGVAADASCATRGLFFFLYFTLLCRVDLIKITSSRVKEWRNARNVKCEIVMSICFC